ncbi:MAG: branched-chain amino acid ABC transporter permease [Ectothiorhodospiraceae bacterium]|nr:branched-chain amino acid ABC transporter permease [Ectothiorhodospiraceae bacterium]MCH8503747.1 branched-chain amino acid ABC transporter permease [Ectothiorhodospiraceae bacterium]
MRSLPRSVQVFLLALTVLLAFYPVFGEMLVGDRYDYWLQKLTSVMILAIMAVSLDLLVGVTGMVSIAHAAFFGLAGYTMVMVAPEWDAGSIWILLPAAVLAAALAALVMGVLIIRTHGIFFIMATIAFSQMIYYIFHDSDFAGGSDGTYLFGAPTVELFGRELLNLSDRVTLFYVTLVSLLLVYLLLRTMLRAPFGRVLFGIKENEERVRAMGYNPLYYKLVAFVIGGTLAGFAGVLSATQYQFIDPSQVNWHLSAEVLIMVILGGLGTLWGPILGAFAFEGLHYWFSSMTRYWELPMGVVVILMVLVLPKGIAGGVMWVADKLERRPSQKVQREETAAGRPMEVKHD